MILECTDCRHCADFDSGWRVLCCNPSIDATSIEDYHPAGNGDASYCEGFDDTDEPTHFVMGQWDDAMGGKDGTYEDMRKWVAKNRRPTH